MNLFPSILLFSLNVVFLLLAVNGAPAPNVVPRGISSPAKTSTTPIKASSTSVKSSTTTGKSSFAPSKSSSNVMPSPTKTSFTLSSTATYPTPTVPIGAGGGPFATVQGRMFQIQSKIQYFAGRMFHVEIYNEWN